MLSRDQAKTTPNKENNKWKYGRNATWEKWDMTDMV